MIYLAGDTMVTLANGREKRIDKIQIGEMLLTKKGSIPVWNIISGLEKEIAEIEFVDGRTLRVAPDQRFMTDRGCRSIQELCNSELLLLGSEKLEVKAITLKPYGSAVYGIMLEHEAEITYNGIRMMPLAEDTRDVNEDDIRNLSNHFKELADMFQ